MQLPDLTLSDLQSCHRLGSISSKPRPTLVRFRDIEHRQLAWDSKTSLKDTGIIISEFLTKSRHDVFMAARKHFGVRNCWSADGKIVILLPDKTRRKIETQCELNRLTSSYPATQQGIQAPVSTKPPKPPAKTKAGGTAPQNVKPASAADAAARNLRPRQN
ncbi:hypothetical protein NE865_15816 [Phthorimaea operculella]|nr:hypothetical protein NE865_15816 [Phthorimaea operculella]